MNTLEVTYVILVSTTDEESTLQANLFLDMAIQNKICVSQHLQLDVTAEDITEEVDRIFSAIYQSVVHSVVLISEDDSAGEFVAGISSSAIPLLQYFIPHKFFISLKVNSGLFTQGIFSVIPESLLTSPEDEFNMYFRGLSPSNHSRHADPWFQYFWETRYSCSLDGRDGRDVCNSSAVEEHVGSYERNPFVATVIDAVDAHIQALAGVLSCNGTICDPLPTFTQEHYLEMLKAVDIFSQVGTSRRVAFKPSGDPEETAFTIMASPFFVDTKREVSAI